MQDRIDFLTEFRKVFASISEAFVGQEHIVTRVASAIAYAKKRPQNGAIPSPRCLVVGAPSAGKSRICELAARAAGFPSVTLNGGSVSPESFVGHTVSQALDLLSQKGGLVRQHGKNELHGVLIVDELCKLIARGRNEGAHIATVFHNLLGVFGGEDVLVTSPKGLKTAGTKNVVVFATGVFDSINYKAWQETDSAMRALTDFGLPAEFCSRLSHFMYLKPPLYKHLKQIVDRRTNEIERSYSTRNRVVCLPQRIRHTIAKKISAHPLGIRHADTLIHEAIVRQMLKEFV